MELPSQDVVKSLASIMDFVFSSNLVVVVMLRGSALI